jgi:hypothetical protein
MSILKWTMDSITGRDREVVLSLYNCNHIGSGAHSASYPMGTRGFFPRGKADRV